MQYREKDYAEGAWDTYWYDKNLLGDIVAVYSSAGVKLVSYAYSAYGDTYITYHNGGQSTGAAKNPFTYRGYYYDSDLYLYYLESRYYDPITARFISPDDLSYLGANGDLNSYNLYTYCSNDPINRTDKTGHGASGLIMQGAALYYSYVYALIASRFNEDIRSDMAAIGWNPFNSDVASVLEAQKMSFYKGAVVIKVYKDTPEAYGIGLSFGALFIGGELADGNALNHEYGHFLQLQAIGLLRYTTYVALPSLISNKLAEKEVLPFDYYSSPWEATANILGGVPPNALKDEREVRAWNISDGRYIYLIPLLASYLF